MLGCKLSHFSHIQLFATQWIAAHQAPLSMGFSVQEYWSGLPFPNAGKGVEKRESSYTVGGNEYWYCHYGEEYQFSSVVSDSL